MTGGLFPGHPFTPNVKCVIFTTLVAGGYWFLPKNNMIVLLFLLWIPYVAMSWYDYAYNCSDRNHPTGLPFGRLLYLPFKDPDYKKEFESLPADRIAILDKIDHAAMWTLFVASILIVGYVLKSRLTIA
jgi:hypothetical protein